MCRTDCGLLCAIGLSFSCISLSGCVASNVAGSPRDEAAVARKNSGKNEERGDNAKCSGVQVIVLPDSHDWSKGVFLELDPDGYLVGDARDDLSQDELKRIMRFQRVTNVTLQIGDTSRTSVESLFGALIRLREAAAARRHDESVTIYLVPSESSKTPTIPLE